MNSPPTKKNLISPSFLYSETKNIMIDIDDQNIKSSISIKILLCLKNVRNNLIKSYNKATNRPKNMVVMNISS